MDRITENMVKAFSESEGLGDLKDTLKFEYFVNHCIIKSLYGIEDFDISDITTGKDTPGIDGIAIIVNEKLVRTLSDIDLLISLNRQINVKFILIQTKTSDSFSNSEIGNMMTFVGKFFEERPKVFNTAEMEKFVEIKNYIFEKSCYLKKNPQLVLHYVTTGKWSEDKNLMAPFEETKKMLDRTNLFSEIVFKAMGAQEIQTLYRKTKETNKASFVFEKYMSMYTLEKNEVGYCGVLPFCEYKKLIFDSDGNKRSVFEDNIRDFLGMDQDVNRSIKQSISPNNPYAFCMLNNGITIVANSIQITGNMANIDDYQIVNGCQTSNVLIESMEEGMNIDDLMIPVRIIVTQNGKLKDDITRATNSQTSIKKEQLEALSTFQRNLELFYKSLEAKYPLVYERRTGQYGDEIPRTRIVSIPIQIRSVAAMFLDFPSAVSGQYGTIAKRVGERIFKAEDKYIMYYVSALALYRYEELFRSGSVERRYRRTRYHAMMMLKTLFIKKKMQFNSNQMETVCDKMLEFLNDANKYPNVLKLIVKFIVDQPDLDVSDRKCFERKETTDILLARKKQLNQYLKQNGEAV